MTTEEVNTEFRDVLLRFHSYYKYSFTFVGTSDDGKTIEVCYGGSADDIYRFQVKAADGVPFVSCDEWAIVTVFSGTREVFQSLP